MKTNRIFQLLIGLGLALFLASCEYEFIDSPPEPPYNPADTVKFSEDILPIFNTNNYCTSCHKSGGTDPDLTEANAYNSIMSMGLVDLTTPENSKLYTFPKAGSPDHSWATYSNSQSEKVLNWIRQGAINN
jgi:hypothetical protein